MELQAVFVLPLDSRSAGLDILEIVAIFFESSSGIFPYKIIHNFAEKYQLNNNKHTY
jgi:hypothetical protein